MGAVAGCLTATADLLARPIQHPSDDADAQRAKRMMVTISAPLVVIFTGMFILVSFTWLPKVALGTAIVSQVGTYAAWAFYPQKRLEVISLAGYVCTILIGDLDSLVAGARLWSSNVLVMDAALVFNVKEKHALCMIAAVVVYLVAIVLDTCATGYFRELGTRLHWVCDCADPPCMHYWWGAIHDCFWAVFVFLCDFYLTRGFAAGMRTQVAAMEQAVNVTASIAQLLAQYEVEEGRALLQGEASAKLPAELRAALMRLLDNLNEYRPYLPESMLVREGVELSAAEPPGFGQDSPVVTVCFTDIQSSTELWERYPQSMYIALNKHNDVIRSVASTCGGYEVKVIGDAFMLAFRSAEDGCRFALGAQIELAEAKWPSDLLQHPLCAPMASEHGDGTPLWGGPRVRIGVNCGQVNVDMNPVTRRCDYFGPPVNAAARVEACLRHGGLIGVTAAVVSELTPAVMQRLGDPVLVALGARELKGVREPVEVTVLLNRQHAERSAVLVATDGEPSSATRVTEESSMHSAPSSCGLPIGAAPLLREGLQTRLATCASFRVAARGTLQSLSYPLLQMLEVVAQAADMSQGVVVGTMSMQCVVVWNGPRACTDHSGQCLRASDVVRRRMTGVATGACSGELLYGTVSAARRKHVTVIGGCVELSAALAEAAEQSGEAALSATQFGEYCSTQRRALRCPDWTSHSGGSVAVWIVLPPQDTDELWDFAPAEMPAADGLDVEPAQCGFPAERRLVIGPGVVAEHAS